MVKTKPDKHMDLLYSQDLDGFALMTSDSDFTPLVMRILRSGLSVYGFGEHKTPLPFVNACSQFIYTENLESQNNEKPNKVPGSQLRRDTRLVKLLCTAVEQSAQEDGWSDLGQVGQYISNNTSFSPINYGYKKLSELIRASGLFEQETRAQNTLCVRPKN